MDEFKKLMKWEVLVALIALGGSVVSWYYTTNQSNQMQDAKLAQTSAMLQSQDTRITQLEQKSNGYDTQLALIKLQLDTIQSILKDIQGSLKR